MQPHATRTPSGIELPDPDQGTPYIHVQYLFPSTAVMVWEPFPEEAIAEQPELARCGHNLQSFARRWAEWAAGRAPYLETIDPRFAYPQLIPRAAIHNVAAFTIAYHRKEDVRAGVRGLSIAGQPAVRRLGNGSYEIAIPR